MNGKEPLSRYAQLGNGIRVERLDGKWIDALVEDKRAPVADQVAAKMDVGAWFATLSRRMKQIARDLAFGCSTSEVARKHGVTAGRISQLRRSLEESWAAYQQEAWPPASGTVIRSRRAHRLVQKVKLNAPVPLLMPRNAITILLAIRATRSSAPIRCCCHQTVVFLESRQRVDLMGHCGKAHAGAERKKPRQTNLA